LVVETDRFADAEDKTLAAWLSRIEYLVFVGRIVPQKDILAQLRIMAELIKQRPDAVLLIVGRRDLAPGYQREVDRAIDQLGLSKRVTLIGPVHDGMTLGTLYRHARFTLVTSEWESFCVPAVESMYCGTPVVTHDVAPVPEIMGAGGIVIDKRDPRAAARRIAAVWYDSSEHDQLRAAARLRANDFTVGVLRRELLAMFKRVFA
jgi:glycosyltransferase involved in cell wall biosynthesis